MKLESWSSSLFADFFAVSVRFNFVALQAAVNFINVKRKNFLYDRLFDSLFLVTLYVEKAAETMFVQKNCVFNIDEIDYW